MADIRLTEGSICFQDEWLTADDIKARIKEKMDAGDMKFADLAAALEKLNRAMENAHPIEVRIVLPKQDYEKLQKRGGGDDNECVRKAILAFIEDTAKTGPAMEMEAPGQTGGQAEKQAEPVEEKAEEATPVEAEPSEDVATIPCSKCSNPVKITSDERPIELECEFCGTSMVLEDEKENNESEKEEAKVESGEKDEKEQEPEKGIRHQDHFIG